MQRTFVARHALSFPDPEDELTFLEDLLPETVERVATLRPNLGSAFGDAQRILGFRFALQRPRADLVAALRTVVELGVAVFRRAEVAPAATITLTLLGEPYEVPGGVTEHSTAPNWIAAFSAAQALRDRAALDHLCRFNPEAFVGNYDTYFDWHARALLFWHTGRSIVDDLLRTAIATAETAKIYPELGRLAAAPCLRVAQAIHAGDPSTYHDRLVEGLDAYRTLYETPDLSHETSNYVPLRYLGLCSLAHDRGLPCPVESDYLPHWIVAGDLDVEGR